MPWASIIIPAVDKIAQAAMYQSPYERQKRGLEMAQIGAQGQLLPLQTENQRIQNQLEIEMLQRMRGNAPGGTTTGSPYFVPGKGVGFINPEQASAIQKNQAITNSLSQKSGVQKAEIDNAKSIHDEAEAARARANQQRQQSPVQNNPPITQSIDQNTNGVNSTMINPIMSILQQQKISPWDSQDDQNQSI